MSSGIVLLIVVVVMLVIIAYLVGILIRKRNDSRIAELEERKQRLFDLPVNEEIEEVKKLHLIGQSQTTFREWNQKWIDISTNSFADIENHIFEAENMNDTFHFFKASGEINNIESQLDLVEEDIKSIREALSTLKEQEEKNSARVKHALDLYEELQNSIEENSDNFGSTMTEINKQLKNIEAEFAEFVTLNSSGDPVEASSILDRAEEHTIALGQISEKIPAIVAKLEDDFPDQLDDLESGYRKLIEQNYHFPEKISNVASKKFAKLSVQTQVSWFLLIWTVRKKKTLRFKKKLTTYIAFSNVKLHHTRLLCVKRKFCQIISSMLKKTIRNFKKSLSVSC